MKILFVLFLMISTNSALACDRPVSKSIIESLISGARVDTIRFDCKADCVCADGFNLSYNQAKLWSLSGDVLSFDSAKVAAKEAIEQQKKEDAELEITKLKALKAKLDDGTVTTSEMIKILKYLLKELK